MYYNIEDLLCIYINRYIMYYNIIDILCILLLLVCLFFNILCILYKVFYYRGYDRNVFYYSIKWFIMCFFVKL